MLEKKQTTVDSDYILTSHSLYYRPSDPMFIIQFAAIPSSNVYYPICLLSKNDLNLIPLLQFIFLMSSGFCNTYREGMVKPKS